MVCALMIAPRLASTLLHAAISPSIPGIVPSSWSTSLATCVALIPIASLPVSWRSFMPSPFSTMPMPFSIAPWTLSIIPKISSIFAF
jgi:hypothetical protein